MPHAWQTLLLGICLLGLTPACNSGEHDCSDNSTAPSPHMGELSADDIAAHLAERGGDPPATFEDLDCRDLCFLSYGVDWWADDGGWDTFNLYVDSCTFDGDANGGVVDCDVGRQAICY